MPIVLRARRACITFLAPVLLAIASGCSAPKAPGAAADLRSGVRVVHHAGGRHHCLLVVGETWLQAIDTTLAVIDPLTLRVLRELPLVEAGHGGPATDMAIVGSALYVAIEESGVAVVDVRVPAQPRLLSVATAEELGVRPRLISVVDGDVYVSGGGGAVRSRDRRRFLTDQVDVGRVARAGDRIVASVGRRVIDLERGEYLGAASTLVSAPSARQVAGSDLAFVLRGDAGASFGLMTPEVREIARRDVDVEIRRLRVFDSRLWAVTDRGIRTAAIGASSLEDEFTIDLGGVNDLAPLDTSRVAVAGDFGRAVVWIEKQGTGPGWLVDAMMSVPGHIEMAWSDGRGVIASAGSRSWRYDGTRDPQPAEALGLPLAPPVTSAAARWGSARIDAGGRSMTIDALSCSKRFEDEREPGLSCLATLHGDLWIGHERGITRVRLDAQGEPAILDRVRLDGPVLFIFPLLDGRSAMYVTRHGQFGIVRDDP